MGFIKSSIHYFFWYGYLALLICISFINSPYNSDHWLILSAVLYALIAGFLLFTCFTNEFNFRNLNNTKYASLLLLLMLLWLVLQLCLPIQSSFESYLFGSDYQPEWLSLDAAWSITPERTKWLLLSNLMVFSFFLLGLCLLDSRRRVKELVYVILIAGLIHAILGIFAKFSNVYFVDKVSLDGHFDAARGWFVNRNHFAAFVSLCLISALAMQFKLLTVERPGNWLDALFKQAIKISFFVLLVGMSALFLSESRGGLLAFLFSVLVCACVFIRGNRNRDLRRYFLFGGLVVVVAVSLFFGSGMIDRFTDNALTLGERQTQWAITWQAIKSQFWLGYGGGSYELVFQSMRGYADLRQVIYDQAHNDYLHIWLEQGLVGLALWVAFIIYIFQYVIRAYWRTKSTLVSSILLAGLIVFMASLIQSLVDYPLQIMTIRCYFFVIVALLLSAPNIKHNN